jgi:hypothetical protein
MRIILGFLTQPISPTTTLDFENQLAEQLRELGRKILQWTFNRIEGETPRALPQQVECEGERYRILAPKKHQPLDSQFGVIEWERHLYRPASRDCGEKSIVPLARILGVVANTTPALAEIACRRLAEAGATQRSVQNHLKTQHHVTIGTKRLRELATQVSGEMTVVREETQVERVLELLRQADASSGNRKPVLSAGRDGITLREYRNRILEVASTATLTVYDRSGKRLGSVYVACVPESGQHSLSEQLTSMINATLRGWDGPLPRLCYVTDAGDNEVAYFQNVLNKQRHPRTGEKLHWQRVVDFYHAMERVWTMAEMVFGANTKEGRGWAKKMGKLLKKPNGVSRVLHSAAALRTRRGLSKSRGAEFAKAYRYLRQRTQWMRYHAYQRDHLPIGSGVTEAACKTIFTQRLKLSGMRWTKAGAQVILDLRVVMLSGVWEATYRQAIGGDPRSELRTPATENESEKTLAA